MTTARTRAQDIAKAFMIISVIFFHCYMLTFTDYRDVLKDFNILFAIFPFLLNSFFFYSGYNYLDKGRSYKENVLRRVKQLLIPMAIALVISTITIGSMELIFHHDNALDTLKAIGNSTLFTLMSEPLALMIGFPQDGLITFELILSTGLLWFIYSLFFCSLAFYALVKFTNKKTSHFVSVIIGLLLISFALGQYVGVYLPYCVQAYPVILAIMLTGAFLREHNFLDRPLETKKDYILTILNLLCAEGLVIGTCLVTHYQFGAMTTGTMMGSQFDATLKGFDVFIIFAFSILGTYVFHTLGRFIDRVPLLGTGMSYIGSHSATFYLFHPIFLDLIAITIFQKKIIWGKGQAFFYVAVILILMTATCLLIDLITKKIKEKKASPIENQ